MYDNYRVNSGRNFVVFIQEFIGRVEMDTVEKYGIFQLLNKHNKTPPNIKSIIIIHILNPNKK